ncbi:MAG TPA: polysaccharide deacetylase family protein [Casimicrobiaceae bacterium]
MNGYVLTYHSHHVVGNDYARNDHIALPADLDLITDAGCRIVSLDTLVDSFFNVAADGGGSGDGKLVAITFDDGPIYDVEDFSHPEFGNQRSFLGIMRDFVSRRGEKAQPELSATSFVIASPDARRVIEATYDADYTYIGPGAMTDEWWGPAIETGFISIANHSWDHLHPALPRVAHSRQVRADFTQVLTVEDADAQIADAGRFISAHTRGWQSPFFAYPFGQYNTFLADQYLPQNAKRLGLRAAFTDEPRPITGNENPWCLPRFICGHHWKSPQELATILHAH